MTFKITLTFALMSLVAFAATMFTNSVHAQKWVIELFGLLSLVAFCGTVVALLVDIWSDN